MKRWLVIPIAFSTIFTFCAGKKKSKDKAPDAAPAAAEEQAITADLPAGKDATAYAEGLVGTTVTNWAPVSSTGAVFRYNTMQFAGDGTWSAEGYIEAMDERFDCKESGTWTMTEAESARVATMLWKVSQTSCPTREKGHEIRVSMTLEKGGGYKIQFR